ncbi:uncharacterized protein BYT42DRAFT_576008 [Radiomyces spectabilis]|uniref:uncharacterized protein n=1 Tax=Radiomyces spectabilis TaxID=64574 RepID=UPI00221FD3DF|nr:uncharacterized protein BYT42DRAFT_576008 [Radiomyces spectabilis]KAI8374340.1 hypothetical protein BYT42DRAFT_576008 [Radiomyces spectabilis]
MSPLYWDVPFLHMDKATFAKNKRAWTDDADVMDLSVKRSKRAVTSPSDDLANLSINPTSEVDDEGVSLSSASTPLGASNHCTSPSFALKPVVISTRTSNPPIENQQYQQINQILHQVHVSRHGDPEVRERWWEDRPDTDMEDVQEHGYHYDSMNALLRQVFLQRHAHSSPSSSTPHSPS